MDDKISKIVARMGKFASSTKNDALSVRVSRAANRLAHMNSICEKPLTQREIATIKPFLKEIDEAA